MQAGLNAHLSKPVEPEALFGTLESLISRSDKTRTEQKENNINVEES